jgi:hypothetical protein
MMFLFGTYRVLVGKRLLVRARYRWENNIRIDITEIGWDGVD